MVWAGVPSGHTAGDGHSRVVPVHGVSRVEGHHGLVLKVVGTGRGRNHRRMDIHIQAQGR